VEISGGEAGRRVDLPGAKVMVSPNSVARMEVTASGFRVGAKSGTASIVWSDGRVLEIASGEEYASARSNDDRPTEAPVAAPKQVAPAEPPATRKPVHEVSDGNKRGLSLLSEETELLRRALKQLREDHDARRSLATLDEYGRRFPGGELSQEALSTRIEALLASGDTQGALELLERLSPSQLTLSQRVVRGELRLGLRRTTLALEDFQAALLFAKEELAERALYGRAACFLALGQETNARADLEQYLARHPRGRFAAAARAALEKKP
jgi:tetratricopeptide (TPR) repeat protein